MPKKRHYAKYSKPQSTAPHSLESSGRQSNIHHEEPHSRSVNDILANLRRTALASHANASHAQAQTQAQAASAAVSNGGATTVASTARQPALSPISAVFPTPSVPPEIAHILLPGVPATGRGSIGGGGVGGGGASASAVAAGGRRRPAGPAPPPSWLAQSRHAPRHTARAAGGTGNLHNGLCAPNAMSNASMRLGLDMPGIGRPARGSLVDRALRCMATDWHIQKHYNQYYLVHLQGPLRAALLSYLGRLADGGKGVTIGDLKALLVPKTLPALPGERGVGDVDVDSRGSGEPRLEETDSLSDNPPSPSTLNEDVRYLDLSGSVGQSLSLKELSDLLFPGGAMGPLGQAKSRGRSSRGPEKDPREEDAAGLLESWDLPDVVAPRRALLPNLTHLSLALDPDRPGSAGLASWRHLLALASHLPMLTHLRLAYWPEPTLTPNAKFSTVVAPHGRRVPYGGTFYYSHTLDSDWAEAVLLVRKLSKALYGLAYLDLTGCAAWFPALVKRVDGDQVDWAGDWGKITTLVLRTGGDDDSMASADDDASGAMRELHAAEQAERAKTAAMAQETEQHIRRQRAGQGRFITVEYDRDPERRR